MASLKRMKIKKVMLLLTLNLHSVYFFKAIFKGLSYAATLAAEI
jgi:hypothetical protein